MTHDPTTAEELRRRRWPEVETILDAALDLAPAERPALLDRRCGGDVVLRREVERLLAGCEDAPDFLARPVHEHAALLLAEGAAGAPDRDPFRGRRLGPWLLEDRLGEGGMGVVYRGRRADGDYRQEVAVKLAPGVLLSRELKDRFHAERQLLAGLRHPHIAPLLDGGATAEGIPYLVTELVDGEPVDRYCEIRDLDLHARLRLFLQVCSAVEHLHRNLIVHRDLKAANILVDLEGRAHLLDFGIAKLLDAAGAGGATRAGRQPMTPEWAAPEQVRGEAVTTAADVYALGLLLYRLLVGRAPTASAAGGPPPPPSEVAPGRRRRELHGDLDAITLAALDPDPEERYPSAAELAADLRRHLDGLPVEVCPRSFRYRLGKLVRRHRAAAALAALLGVSLVTGVAGVAWQARAARQERDAARREGRRAQRTAAFLEGLFAAADPFGESGRELSVRELLRRGAEQVRQEQGDAETRAALLASLGRSLQHLGASVDAAAVHRRALALRRAHFGATSPEAAWSVVDLAESLAPQGRGAEAEALLRDAVRILRARAPGSWALANALNFLAVQRLGRPDAEPLLREALTLAGRLRGTHPGFEATVLNNLSVHDDLVGQNDESLALLRRAIAAERDVYGDTHPNLARMESNLAIRLQARGRLDEAEASYRRALAVLGRTVAAGHPVWVGPLTSLGHLLLKEGKVDAAAPMLELAVAIAREQLPPDNFQRLAAETNRASLELAGGDLEDAERAYRGVLERMQVVAGTDHAGTARLRSLLGETLRREGRLDEAEVLLRGALANQRGPAARPAAVAETLESLAAVLRATGRADEGAGLERAAAALQPGGAPAAPPGPEARR